jgi:hypothetical protein
MRMPEFNAEASLYKPDRSYLAVGHYELVSGIFPQFVCNLDCLDNCLNACPYPGEGVPPSGIRACLMGCHRQCCKPN